MKEIKNFVKSLKKYKDKSNLSEKDYLKGLILEEKDKNKNINSNELSQKFGVTKEVIEDISKEMEKEESEKTKEKPKKIKKDKRFTKKNKEKIEKLFDKQDKKTLIDFFSKIVLFGIPLNFAMLVVSKGYFTFNFYSWIGWGIALWFTKKELVNIIRGIIHK